MKYKGVIFDLDGTLIDSLEDIADSMNSVLERHGFPPHGLEAYKRFIGRGIKNLVARSLPEGTKDEGTIAVCLDSMLEEYGRNCMNKTRPYDGIAGLLDELVRRKMELAVFSNKADELTKKLVSVLLPDWRFGVVMGSKAAVPGKPDPEGALLISRLTGKGPESFIYVGDSDVDMETANNAGMSAAGALWGFRTREELIASGAKYLLDHPRDLIRVLREADGS